MKTIREIARLHLDKELSMRAIAASCKLSVSTVQGYVKKIDALGLDHATVSTLSDRELQERLRPAPKVSEQQQRPEPDIAKLVAELKQSKGKVTRQLLHEEYLAQYPDGYKKTRFYELLRQWEAQDKATMRMTHTPGDKLFIDFSGDKPSWIDPATGEVNQPELYVAVLAACRAFHKRSLKEKAC